MPKVVVRPVSFAPDSGIYIFPPGAPTDHAPTTEMRQISYNEDESLYIFPKGVGVGPTPTPPPTKPVVDAEKLEWPGLGPHPVVRMKPKQAYYVLIPYAANVMAVQAGGTFDDTVTDLELTAAPTPGDRNYWSTPAAGVPYKDRANKDQVAYPARAYGDAHGSGLRLGWSANGSFSDFKRPNDGQPWAITLYSETGGTVEFFVQGA